MQTNRTGGTDGRQAPLRGMPVVMRWFVLLVVLLAAAALVAVVVTVGWTEIGAAFSWTSIWLLLGMILLADVYPLSPWLRDVQGRVAIHWSAALLLGALVAFGPAALVAFPFASLVAVSSLGGAWWRRVFNVAVVVIEGAVGAAVLAVFWGRIDAAADRGPLTLLVQGVLLAVLWEVINVSLVATAQRLSGAMPWWQAVRRGVRTTAMWLAALLTAPIIAHLALAAPVLLLLLAVVIVTMHHIVALTTRTRDRARTDVLTGLLNRGAVMQVLDDRLSHPDRHAVEVPVLLIDLDGFKAVNDTHGHQAGDQLLVEIAGRIRAAISPTCVAGRMGGDEFMVVCGEGADPEALRIRLDGEVRQRVALDDGDAGVACSIGLAVGAPGMDSVDLFREVDKDLYRVKHGRHPRVRDIGR